MLVVNDRMIVDGLTALLRSHSSEVEMVGQTTDAQDALRSSRGIHSGR